MSFDSARVSVARRAAAQVSAHTVSDTRYSAQDSAQISARAASVTRSSDVARASNASAVSAALNEIFAMNLLALIKAAVSSPSNISVFEP